MHSVAWEVNGKTEYEEEKDGRGRGGKKATANDGVEEGIFVLL